MFDFCIQAAIAIAGGEVWIVKQTEGYQPDKPTDFIHNLDPTRNQKAVLLARTSNHVIVGSFPFQDGGFGLFVWSHQPSKATKPGRSM